MSPIVIVVIAVGLVAGVLVFASVFIRQGRGEDIEERLGRYAEPGALLNLSDEFKESEKALEEKKAKQESALRDTLDGLLANRSFAEGWKTQLARADLKLTVGEYFASHLIAMSGLFLAGYFILFPLQVVPAIIAGGVGFFVPRIYVNMKMGGRLKNFENQLPDLLSLWVNSLRSGYSVMQALEAISREAAEPTAGEIKRVVQEAQFGIPMDQAFDHLLTRMPSEDLDLVITAVNIQREVGGNLAEILEVIGHTIRERIKIKGEIRVLTAQGRITGYLISALPILLGLFMFLVNRPYMGRLVDDRGCGWPMLAIGLGMIAIGWSVIQRIVDIEV